MNNKKILVTGATGYIGSHTIVELLSAGYDVIGVDNLSNSSIEVLSRIRRITNREFIFKEIDIRDESLLNEIFTDNNVSSVIHFAGYKAVGESVNNPLLYYSNNIKGTVTLLEVMNKNNVKNIVFSSSCTVYGDPQDVPVDESASLKPQNPYGRTKSWIDKILKDISNSDNSWSIISLRYFNPIGAHKSGFLGDEPAGVPNNLLPYITQTAIGRRTKLSIFGNDYPTKDGTCIRDYIHIMDLADGHLKALQNLYTESPNIEYINLGTGQGYSVLEVVNTFMEVNNIKIAYQFSPRRIGDAAIIFADPSKAKEYLNWEAKYDLADMLQDAWRFQKENPNGYLNK